MRSARFGKARAAGLLGAGLLGAVLQSTPAAAQAVPYSPTVAYGPFEIYPSTLWREGPGFKVLRDGLVLHPGIAADLGYDSNVLMQAQSVAAGVFRLRAHLDLATLPPQRLDEDSRPFLKFRLGAALEYRQYFSSDPRIGAAQQLNAESSADLRIKEGDPLSLQIYNQFLVTSDARNLEIANYNSFAPRVYDRIGLVGSFRPGLGPLEIGLAESLHFDYFVPEATAYGRSLGNDLSLFGALRVLPQTVVRLELRSSYVQYLSDLSAVPRSAPLRILGGVQTLLLPWLGASVYLGYGNSLHHGYSADTVKLLTKNNISASEFVGGIEARLLLVRQMQLRAGWARDFFDSIYASFFRDDHLYVHYQHTPWRTLTLGAQLDVYLRDYGALSPATTLGYSRYARNATARSDTLIGFGAEATYRPLAWLMAGVSYNVLDDRTALGAELDYRDDAGRMFTKTDNLAFVRHVLLFKADVAY
ncbi:MAG: hypothetical protein U1A78_08445 [Polyangia bacterium]